MSSSPMVVQKNRVNTDRWGEQSRRQTFPCENPDIPQMRSFTVRVNTFGGFRSDIGASISELADAGLYYLGSEDRTKCFYCSGCLMNWNLNDDPMEEHAKWFPECEYVLRKRGCEYVTSISEKYSDVVRPESTTTTHHGQGHSSTETHEVLTSNLDELFPSATLNGMLIRWWI